jgi:hypothetical protein
MKSPARCAAWLLPFVLTGCSHMPFHKTRPVQSQVFAPPIEPSKPIELASLELPASESVIPARPVYNMREEEEPIKPPVKRRKPSSKDAEEAANNPEGSGSTVPAVSAIGELTSGDPADFRQQTEASIAAIERGLTGINRTLSDPEQKTADHIKEFVKQAKTALASGDVDGAHTLAEKAKVLLDELTK